MTFIEAEYGPTDWTIYYDATSGANPAEYFVTRLKNRYEKVVKKEIGPLDFMVGLKTGSVNWTRVVDEMIEKKEKAMSFNLVLTKSELRLDVGVPTGTQYKLGAAKVPTDLEDYRTFLQNLANWTEGTIVSESDFKDWNKKNPKKPPKYKNYDEMVKASKTDTDAFKVWAKTNAAANKALAELEKTKKLKSSDPARVNALKAIDAAVQAYNKSF